MNFFEIYRLLLLISRRILKNWFYESSFYNFDAGGVEHFYDLCVVW